MTSRIKPLIVGNWKMNMTASEAEAHVRTLLPRLGRPEDREIALAPPFTALPAVGALLKGSTVKLAAQDLFWEDEGPFTGEISGVMLQELGVTYVLVAHSERRHHFEESDRIAGLKTRAALRSGLRPILCVGEDEMERESGRADSVVRSQVLRGLAGCTEGEAANILVAYEPIWAIGTGRAATSAQAAEMHGIIRHELRSLFKSAAAGVRILYGGSVTPDNIEALMSASGIDGALVGGASLKADQFARIATFTSGR